MRLCPASPIPRAAGLVTALLLGACTAVLVPGDEDGLVHYCDISSDCPELEDNRYVALCVLPENLSPGADKVCSPDYETIPCGGAAYPGDHLLTQVYLEALADPSRYGRCPVELLGTRGCGPSQEGCAEGLAVNVYGTCDDPEAELLSVGAGAARARRGRRTGRQGPVLPRVLL